MKMLGLRRLWKILKITKVDKIFIGFLVFVLGMSLIIQVVEPNIVTYGDAIWYSFSVITTIGFGDYYAVTTIGRTCTILVGLYGILIVGLIPGVLVSYYVEFLNVKADQTVGAFMEKLENLENLSKEELRQISEKVKEKRYKLK